MEWREGFGCNVCHMGIYFAGLGISWRGGGWVGRHRSGHDSIIQRQDIRDDPD